MNKNRLFRLFVFIALVLSTLSILNHNILTTQAQSSLAVDIRSNGTDNNQQTGFSYRVRNTGGSAVAGVSVRIYYTLDGANAGSNYALEKYWDQSGIATVSAPMQSSGSTWYFTVNYGSTSLAAGGSWEFQTGLHLVSWGTDFNSGNDWFHSGFAVGALPAAFTATSNIPAYINGTLVSGSEPGGTPATTAPTSTRTNTPVDATAIPTSTRTNTPTSGSQVYQAEQAVMGGGAATETTNAGYLGSSYVNFPASGGSLQFNNVGGGSGGSVTLQFRNALGATASRTGLLIVNGASQNITFQPTGAWTTWVEHSVTVNLNSGTGNTIRLETNGQDLANIDQLTVGAPGGPTPTRTNTPPVVPSNTPGSNPTATPTRTNTAQPTPQPGGGRQMERLNRGVVRVNQSGGNYVSWRLLGTDPSNISFNVYQGATKLTASPITNSTNYFHSGGSSSASYTVRAVINGVEQPDSESSLNISSSGYLNIPIQRPAGGTTPDNVAYTYTANDASVGDLDGDGVYEVVLKWDPTNAKDNSQSGYTGNVFIDAYRLNGTRMWRIDLGRNIRAGAHYTQFMVYDFDGDGRAEIMMKTADGTRSATGQVVGSSTADHRNSSGYILAGPEYLTVFNGQTGAILATANYDPPRGTVSSWGDSYGNRVDRFLAGVAYLDGTRPSAIFARGYYTRTVVAAWDWRNGQLTKRWTFDSNSAGSTYTGEGNHQLSIADSDNDGRDEIMYGSMAINDNGSAMWDNNTKHGDAYHVGDFDPNRAGLEVFKPSEHTDQVADWLGDARTGQIIWSHPTCGCDNGRGVAGDIYAGSPGAEMWSSAVSNLTSATGQALGRKPGSTNFLIWWDGDTVRELLDGNHIDKYGTGGDTRLLTASGASSNNGTKSTPALSVDIFGDWREEVIFRASDESALRIYVSTAVTSTRIYTLMHNSQYRVAIAWQNTAYNQPPHPSFFLGNNMTIPPQPSIYTP